MPYLKHDGSFERASRVGHVAAAEAALAATPMHYIPMEHIADPALVKGKITKASALGAFDPAPRVQHVISIDGSQLVVPVRDGLPSIRFGYVQVAAARTALRELEALASETFVSPSALATAITSGLLLCGLPLTGIYVRAGVSAVDSWREQVQHIFQSKSVELPNATPTLLDLLFIMHGTPGQPAPTVPVTCPSGCGTANIAVPPRGALCPQCAAQLFATDALRTHEEVQYDEPNTVALGRLMGVLELLVLVAFATSLWSSAQQMGIPDSLESTLLLCDGPLALYGPPAKLKTQALAYLQAIGRSISSPGLAVCGIEKTGQMVEFAGAVVRHKLLGPGELLTVDHDIVKFVANSDNPLGYGSDTYWGRKFIYHATDGRVLVMTVMPVEGAPYTKMGGQPHPSSYPTLGSILDVLERTPSSRYRNAVLPISEAHAVASYPLGPGQDVLRMVATRHLALAEAVRA